MFRCLGSRYIFLIPAFVFYGIIVATLGSKAYFHSGVAVYPEPVEGSQSLPVRSGGRSSFNYMASTAMQANVSLMPITNTIYRRVIQEFFAVDAEKSLCSLWVFPLVFLCCLKKSLLIMSPYS